MRRERGRFRPMGIADILDETVELYRSNFKLLIGIAAVLYVPYFLVEGFLTPTAFDVGPSGELANLPGIIAFYLLILLLALVVQPIVTGALTFAISDRYLGRETSIVGCFRRILAPSVFFRFLGAVLLVNLIIGAVVFVAAMLAGLGIFASLEATGIESIAGILFAVMIGLVVGAGALFATLYLWIRLALVPPCFIIERNGVSNAITRSWGLIQGNMLKGFVLLFLAALVAGLVPQIVTLPTQLMIGFGPKAGPAPSHIILAVHAILYAVSATLLVPVISIVVILLYYDLRIRKEGFDLQLLANQLDARTRQFSPAETTQLPQEGLAPPPPGPPVMPPPTAPPQEMPPQPPGVDQQPGDPPK